MTKAELTKPIFDLILEANADYVQAVGTPAEEIMLEVCSTLFEKLILSTGLVNEYAEYCRLRQAG